MILNFEQWQRVSLTSLVVALVSTVGLMIVALAAFQPAAADPGAGGDGGGGSGQGTGDGCTVTGWAFVRSIDAIYRDNNSDGDLCDGMERQTIEAALRIEGAVGCADNRDSVMAVWYVHDRANAWAPSNGYDGNDYELQTRERLTRVVNNTPDRDLRRNNGQNYKDYSPPVLRELAVNSIAKNQFNTVLCVWASNTNNPPPGNIYQCSYLDDWRTNKWMKNPNVTGSTRFPGPAQAQASCFQKCPPGARGRPGQLIPAGQANNVNNWCSPPDRTEDEEHNWGSTLAALGYGQRYAVTNEDPFSRAVPYAWTTEISQGNKIDLNQLPFASTMQSKNSAFARFLLSYCGNVNGCAKKSSNEASYEDFKDRVGLAEDQTSAETHVGVNLSTAQQQAMAQGRVVNVGERTIFAQVGGYKTRDRHYSRTCTETIRYNSRGKEISRSRSCGNWRYTPDYRDDRVGVNTSLARTQTPQYTGGFQILTNRCNTEGFTAAPADSTATVNSNSTGVVSANDAGKYYAAAQVSRVHTNPANFRWGTIAQNATNTTAFYDRLCQFDGQRETGAQPQADTTLFRSGDWENLNLVPFTPRSTSLLTYGGSSPEALYLTRDLGSTPDLTQAQVRAACENGQASVPAFGASTTTPETARQFTEASTHIGAGASTLPGCYDRIQVRSIWASDNGKPQVLTARYRYTVDGAMTVPGRNVGFGDSGGQRSWASTRTSTALDGFVNAVNNSATSPATPALKAAVTRHTGTGSTDAQQAPLYYGTAKADGRWNREPAKFNENYWSIRFVRSTGS